jgi:hypothetical protein
MSILYFLTFSLIFYSSLLQNARSEFISISKHMDTKPDLIKMGVLIMLLISFTAQSGYLEFPFEEAKFAIAEEVEVTTTFQQIPDSPASFQTRTSAVFM